MKKITTLLAILLVNIVLAQCPTFEENDSNPYYIKFSSTIQLNTNNDIIVNGLNFVNAGEWYNNGLYYYSWSNTTGQPLDLSNFSITFGNDTCTYPQETLSINQIVQLDKPKLYIDSNNYLNITKVYKISIYTINGQFVRGVMKSNKIDLTGIKDGYYAIVTNLGTYKRIITNKTN